MRRALLNRLSNSRCLPISTTYRHWLRVMVLLLQLYRSDDHPSSWGCCVGESGCQPRCSSKWIEGVHEVHRDIFGSASWALRQNPPKGSMSTHPCESCDHSASYKLQVSGTTSKSLLNVHGDMKALLWQQLAMDQINHTPWKLGFAALRVLNGVAT